MKFPYRVFIKSPCISLGIPLAITVAITGCASLRGVDQSQLNHKAMDLNAPLSAEKTGYLTPLGSNLKGAKLSGACTTCAH